MKKCYLLLCLMALTSLLLICNPVLAGEQNSEDDGWKAVEKAADEGVAEAAVAEVVTQGFEDYEEYKEIMQDEVRFGVTDPKDQVDATEESSDQPALGLN